MRINKEWRAAFEDYMKSGTITPMQFNYVEDYVQAKLNQILQRQIIRKDHIYDWTTRRIIRHRLISVAEDAGLIWKTEEIK